MSSETSAEQPVQEPGGEEDRPSRVSGGCVVVILAGIAVLVLKAVVTAAPYTAYFVAGVLACVAWQKARAWLGKRRDEPAEEGQDEEEQDVAVALRELSGPGRNVLLTELKKKLGVADTKAVRSLLKAAGIRVRDGVRAPAGNGPGVHQDDIPAPPLVEEAPSESGCSCRSEPTTPTPTTGPTVEAIGLAGVVVKDGSETARRHRVK